MRSNNFTLTELIAVLLASGIVAGLTLSLFQNLKRSSNYNDRINIHRELYIATHQYSNDTKIDYHIKNPHTICDEEKEKHSSPINYIMDAEDLCKLGYVDHKYIQQAKSLEYKD